MRDGEKKMVNILLVSLLLISAFSAFFVTTTDAAVYNPIPQWPNPRGNAGSTGLSSQNTSENYGNVAWQFSTAGKDISSSIIDDEGNIYFISGGSLYALNPNGTQKWEASAGSGATNPSIGPSGAIYFTTTKSVYCILQNGTEKWHSDFSYTASYVSDVMVSSNGKVYAEAISGKTGYMYALDSSGKVLWTFSKSFDDENFYMHTPVMSSGPNRTIYTAFADYCDWMGTTYENVYAISETGEVKQILNISTNDYMMMYEPIVSSIVISYDNTIYVIMSGSSREIHAFNLSGEEIWNFTAYTSYYIGYDYKPSLSIGPKGNLYFTVPDYLPSDDYDYYGDSEYEGDATIYSLNPDGNLLWSKVITGGSELSACSIGKDGSIYFGAENSYSHYTQDYDWWSGDSYSYIDYRYNLLTVYSLHPDGSTKWKTELENYSYSSDVSLSDPSIGNNGIVYLGSSSGHFYAIGGASTPPRNLNATAGRGYVDLRWDFPEHNGTSPILSYKIYRFEPYNSYNYDDYSTQALIATVPVSNQTYHDDTVTNGLTYTYYVTAVNLYESLKSNSVIAKPEGAPSKPLNLETRAGDSNVSLSWEVPEDNGGNPIIEYRVHRGTIEGSEAVIARLGEYDDYYSYEPSYNYVDTTVCNGKTYYYYVTAVTSYGEGDASRIVTATPITRPSAPVYLKITAGDGYINLTWQAPENNGGASIQKYIIYSGTVQGEEIPIATVGSYARFYQDRTVSNGGTYYYYITAENSAGESERSNKVSGKPEEGLGKYCASESSSTPNLLVPSLLGAIMLLIAAILLYMVARNKKRKVETRKKAPRPLKIKKKIVKKPPIGR